jgi:hypothetical protein
VQEGEGPEPTQQPTLLPERDCHVSVRLLTAYETDHETNTVCTLSRTASASSLDDQLTVATVKDDDEPSCMEKDV